MNSKKLDSILKNIPPATIADERKSEPQNNTFSVVHKNISKKTGRIVAEIPIVLKEDIKNYIDNNRGMTERIVILKALRLFGFNIKDDWIVDKRSMR